MRSASSEGQQVPRCGVLTLKHELWASFKRMRDTFGQAHFDYMPRTPHFPPACCVGVARRGEGPHVSLVMKPSNSSRSRGIWFVRSKLAAGESPMASTSTSALKR